ncbi:RHS repeat-associated core domain-containing protein [Tepidibacillus marianensis]
MSYRYDAFGNLFNNMAAPYNATGYTGKTYDAKAGLMDYGARWYSPSNGRFISEDTFTGWKCQPQSLNRYNYTQNNPVNFTDPTGHCIPVGIDSDECIIVPQVVPVMMILVPVEEIQEDLGAQVIRIREEKFNHLRHHLQHQKKSEQ